MLVSGVKLAVHFGISRQHIDRLAAAGVIERRATDGLFDLDLARLKYLSHLRTAHRHSPRTDADAEHTAAKAALLRLRIAEKKKETIPRDEAIAHMEEMIGLFLSRLSGFSARCGGRDLAARRAIDQAVHDLRLELSEACTKLADDRGEP